MTREVDPPRRRVPASGTSSGPGRVDTAAHLANRHRAATRARVIRRRRAGVLLGTLVVVAGVVAACNAVTGATSKPKKTTSTTVARSSTTGSTRPQTTQPQTTTTTTLPASFAVGIHTFDWVEKGRRVTHLGPTGASLPGRVLTTEVRYPTLAGATQKETVNAQPATAGGPYPVIVFAHGFETEPIDYAPLLDGWVRAGFVVVSPIFPDENLAAVTAAGGMDDASIADTLEDDVYSEPGDIVYVLKQLKSIGADGWGSRLSRIMNLSDVGLAGQSDGANVVAALTYASGLGGLYSRLAVAPKAVAVLSGTAWSYLPNGKIGSYGATSSSPSLLQVQSDADGCVSPSEAADLFASVQGGLSSKWFVTLLGAGHLGPYEGVAPWGAAVENVTTKFFELELGWRSPPASAAAILTAGTVGGAAQITTTVGESTIPPVEVIPGC